MDRSDAAEIAELREALTDIANLQARDAYHAYELLTVAKTYARNVLKLHRAAQDQPPAAVEQGAA